MKSDGSIVNISEVLPSYVLFRSFVDFNRGKVDAPLGLILAEVVDKFFFVLFRSFVALLFSWRKV